MDRRNLCKLGLAGIGTMALSKTANAMNLVTKESEKKKWVVLYGTGCGSTGEYANFINKGMGEIADVVNIEESMPSVDDYDYFIIGGWRSGESIKPDTIPNFVTSNKDTLKDKIKGLFLVLGNGGTPEVKPPMTSFFENNLITPSGATNAETKILFGRNKHSCSGLTMFNEYDNVSEDAGVEFGQKILSTAMRTMRTGMKDGFGLEHIHPGSRSAVTSVHYSIPHTAQVELSIHTINGRRMATLVSARQKAGSHSFKWDTRTLAPGYYICQLKADGLRATRTAQIFAH